MTTILIFMLSGFYLSVSAILDSCDDDIFKNELKTGNWICKLDKNYEISEVPGPHPQNLDSKLQIYEVSGVDETEHTISIHFKHYIQWTDMGLSYLNRSL